jgi:hypothetical protein
MFNVGKGALRRRAMKKPYLLVMITCEITVIFPLSAVADRENKGNISNQKINNRLLQ